MKICARCNRPKKDDTFRFCHACGHLVKREMITSGYLTPMPGIDRERSFRSKENIEETKNGCD